MISCGYNGWADASEAEREGLELYEQQSATSPLPNVPDCSGSARVEVSDFMSAGNWAPVVPPLSPSATVARRAELARGPRFPERVGGYRGEPRQLLAAEEVMQVIRPVDLVGERVDDDPLIGVVG